MGVTGTTTQVRLARRPVGRPDEDTWDICTADIPSPSEGEFLVAVDHVSLDPAMRGWINDAPSYLPPVGIGEVMRAHATGTVVDSRHPDYRTGDTVSGFFGVTGHAVSDGTGVARIDHSVASPATWLGALGLPGMTAWFGLLDIGRLRPGDTVVVSGAAGAVGSVVGQIARALDCRTIGIAGGAEKCVWLREIGFDHAIDYKTGAVSEHLAALLPHGCDVFFDNVGGTMLEAGLANIGRSGRIVLCGAISAYNATEPPPGPRGLKSLIVERASMTGFLVLDYEDRYPEAVTEIGSLMAAGKLIARETVLSGVESFPDALLGLFDGINTGKLVLKL